MKIHLVSLGCAKNLVDSEVMLGRLKKAGWTYTPDPKEAETIIINTCSFIEPAANESIDTILELARFKHNGTCRRIVVTGCLPERYRETIVDALPEVDFFLGTGAYREIVKAVKHTLKPPAGCLLPDPNTAPLENNKSPRLLSSLQTAYLKIAEGCSRHCTYCIIPKLRGKQKSRRPDDIVAEAQILISKGIKELILIAQDTTAYGNDLGSPAILCRVLEDIANLANGVWIRLLYGHPESMDTSIIQTVAMHPNICSYIDLPIQHASESILKKMGRNYTSENIRRLCDKLRSLAPEAAIRTTVIVGFPGETDKDFEILMNLVEDIRFDHLGVFLYSDAPDLPSHRLSGHIPETLAQERYDRLMARQMEISMENNQKYLSRVYDVLIEKSENENLFTGRTFFQAPDIDGLTFVRAERLKIGSFSQVKITETLEYDLIGEAI